MCTGDIYIYIYVSICLSVDLFFAFGCWTLAIADSLSSQFRKHLDAPRKAEDAQVSDVYSFLGSKRLVDPVPQQHCHAMPCYAMLCHAMLSSIAIPCAADLGVEVLQGDHAVLCCIGSDSEADCKIFKMSQYLEKNLKRTKTTTVPEV